MLFKCDLILPIYSVPNIDIVTSVFSLADRTLEKKKHSRHGEIASRSRFNGL